MGSLLGASMLIFASSAVAMAQDEPEPVTPAAAGKSVPIDRLTLTVQGHARVPADQVEIEVVVQAQGEDGETAEKKHREKLKHVQAAMERLKATFEGKEVAPEKPVKKKAAKKTQEDDEEPAPRDDAPRARKGASDDDTESKDDAPDPPSFSIELREGRTTIGVARSNVNPDGSPSDGSMTVATAILFKLKGISGCSKPKVRRRLAKILDTAIEAGADSGVGGVGSRPAFRFRAKDNDEVRAIAQADALTKGRARAKKLAELAGRELGTLKGIGETGWMLRAGSSDQVGFDSVIGRIGNNKMNNYEMTLSASEVELECELTLEFELGKTVEAPAVKAPEKPAK